MCIRSVLIILGSYVMLLCACMSLPLYTEVATELEETRIQRDEVQR